MKTVIVTFKHYELNLTYDLSPYNSGFRYYILSPNNEILAASSNSSETNYKAFTPERLKKCLVAFLEVEGLIKVSDREKFYKGKLKQLHEQGILKNSK